jgi:DNA-binding HxlR family transcriptional regulator
VIGMTEGSGGWDVPYRVAALEVIELLRRKWTIAILAELAVGEVQYKDLRAAINAVEARVGWSSHHKPLSDRVFSDTLQEAQDNGLIERRAEAGHFGNLAWYRLTATGRSLLRAIRPLAEWGQQHRYTLHRQVQPETE